MEIGTWAAHLTMHGLSRPIERQSQHVEVHGHACINALAKQ
jgi:hypothetical protein